LISHCRKSVVLPKRRRLRANRWTLRCLLADRAGATTVEFALVGLLFFALILGVIETGRVLWTYNALHYAVQQAARCASVNTTNCGTEALMQSFASNIAGSNVPASVFHLNSGSPPAGTPACPTASNNLVTASYAMQLYIPYVSMHPTLTASACFPKKA
jgi:Flp pilus assembly protein TadG